MGEEPKEQSVASCEGWQADWVSSHCQTNQDTGKALEEFVMRELGQRMTLGSLLLEEGGSKDFFFFFFYKFFSFLEKELSAFVPREAAISMETDSAGNLV